MSTDRVQLSLVVPAYNESRRIVSSLRSISDYLAEQSFSSEIIVVDDGSEDDTFQVVKATAEHLRVPVRALRYETNRGKGWALKVGFEATTGDWIVFSDADLATPIEHVADAVQRLERGAQIVIGSRKSPGACIEVHQPWLREKMGKFFTLLVRRLIADVSDATCGFKGFQGDVGRDVFARVRIPDWSFDAEILLIARLRGYGIEEFPVVWRHHEGTKVRLFRDVLATLHGLVRIRINTALGRYGGPVGATQVVDLSGSWVSPSAASVEARPEVKP